MRGFHRRNVEEPELGHTIALFREAPGEVLAEREAALEAELTPNMAVLGDPRGELVEVAIKRIEQ